MVDMATGVVILIWLVVGVALCMMAGLTHDFEKRFFPAFFMIPLGPLGLLLWLLLEKREAKRGRK